MKELQRKQRIKKWLYSWPSLLLLALIAFFLAKGAVGMIIKERQSAERVAGLEEKSGALALREESVGEGIKRLQTEEGILEEIKEKFSVTREGECVAIIVDDTPKTAITGTSTAEWLKGRWEKFKNLWRDTEPGYNAHNDK